VPFFVTVILDQIKIAVFSFNYCVTSLGSEFGGIHFAGSPLGKGTFIHNHHCWEKCLFILVYLLIKPSFRIFQQTQQENLLAYATLLKTTLMFASGLALW